MTAATWLLIAAAAFLVLAMTLPTGDQPELTRADIPSYAALLLFTGTFLGSIALLVTGTSAL